MKKLIPFFTFFMLSVFAIGQITIVEDNFDSYTAGQKLVQQTTETFWTTWSNSPGGGEDPVISSDQSSSLANSVNLVNDNDLVLLINDKTSGRFLIEFNMFVASGSVGYFNILQDFNGTNSSWGVQAFFAGTTGSVDANGGASAAFSFPSAQWFPVKALIDLEADMAILFVNEEYVTTWIWSKGSFGTGTLLKLDAVNFYGWSDPDIGNSNFYIDDVSVVEVETDNLLAPENLTATVTGNDVDLSWDISSGTPYFFIQRNGFAYGNYLSGTTFTDAHVYPNEYTYAVRAYYENIGFSDISNEATANIEGGVERNMVVLEIGTGTWCGYCPGAAMGADDLVENGKNVAVIEYHNGDSYENTFASQRINYYAISAFPTAVFDGVSIYEGGSTSTSLYNDYLPLYENRNSIPALDNINIEITHEGEQNYHAVITIEETNNYFESSLKLMVVLTETDIPENWGGLNTVDFVCREMYPNANGTTLDFSENQSQTVEFDFTLNAGYEKDNCEFIAFVQHTPSKEILQASKIDMADVTLINTDEIIEPEFTVYPNPAVNYLSVDYDAKGTYTIFDSNGRKVKLGNLTLEKTHIDISRLTSGIFTIYFDTEKGKYRYKFVK